MFRPALAAALGLALVASVAGAQPAGPSQDPAAVPAGTYQLDKSHASVIAKVRHLGMSDFTIRFNTVDASFDFDPKNPTAAKVTATVEADSFDVGNQKYNDTLSLNQHFLKERDIVGNTKNPKITFASTAITRGQGNRGTMAGNLTLNGVTKPVSFDVVFNGTMPGMGGGPQRTGFSATGKIKRSDFQVAPMLPAAAIGDDVTLIIEAEFTKKA